MSDLKKAKIAVKGIASKMQLQSYSYSWITEVKIAQAAFLTEDYTACVKSVRKLLECKKWLIAPPVELNESISELVDLLAKQNAKLIEELEL